MYNREVKYAKKIIGCACCTLLLSGCNSTQAPVDEPASSQSSSMISQAAQKILRNEEYGIELRYPAEWSIDEFRSDREKSGSDIVFDIGIPESHEGIRVDKSSNATVEYSVQNIDPEVIENITDLVIDGEPATRVDTTEFGTTRIFVKHGDTLYEFITGGRMIDMGVIASVKFLP